MVVPPNKEGYGDTFYGCWHRKKFIDYSSPPYLYQLNSIIENSEVADLSSGSIRDAVPFIQEKRPGFIICNTGTYTLKEDLGFFAEVKKNTDAKVIAFGQAATVSLKKFLNPEQ